jgi:hypothetical protein
MLVAIPQHVFAPSGLYRLSTCKARLHDEPTNLILLPFLTLRRHPRRNLIIAAGAAWKYAGTATSSPLIESVVIEERRAADAYSGRRRALINYPF